VAANHTRQAQHSVKQFRTRTRSRQACVCKPPRDAERCLVPACQAKYATSRRGCEFAHAFAGEAKIGRERASPPALPAPAPAPAPAPLPLPTTPATWLVTTTGMRNVSARNLHSTQHRSAKR
jgi:hypothetical protein